MASLGLLLPLHNLLQLPLDVVVEAHLVPEATGVEGHLFATLLLVVLALPLLAVALLAVLVLLFRVLVVLSGLELDVDVDDLVSEDQVLVVATHPRRLGTVLHLRNAEAGKDEVGVETRGVLAVDRPAERHQVTQLCTLSRDGSTRMHPGSEISTKSTLSPNRLRKNTTYSVSS
jgi:hypothetical protein